MQKDKADKFRASSQQKNQNNVDSDKEETFFSSDSEFMPSSELEYESDTNSKTVDYDSDSVEANQSSSLGKDVDGSSLKDFFLLMHAEQMFFLV